MGKNTEYQKLKKNQNSIGLCERQQDVVSYRQELLTELIIILIIKNPDHRHFELTIRYNDNSPHQNMTLILFH